MQPACRLHTRMQAAYAHMQPAYMRNAGCIRHAHDVHPGVDAVHAGCMQAALRLKSEHVHCNTRVHSRRRRRALRRRPPACSVHAACITLVQFSVNEHVHSGRIFQGVFFYF